MGSASHNHNRSLLKIFNIRDLSKGDKHLSFRVADPTQRIWPGSQAGSLLTLYLPYNKHKGS